MPRPPVVRYTGLAGSLLLAVAAYRGGASAPWHPTMTPRTIVAGQNGVLTPLCWLLGTLLLIGAWWAGRHVLPSARWALVTAALWVVPLLPLLPLGSYDVYSYACQGWQQSAGLDPYSGGVDVLGCPWRDAVAPTWYDSPAPYGPVFVVLAAAAAIGGGSLTGTIAVLRIISVLGVALTAACVPVIARRAGVDTGRALWLALACPLVAVHLISGAHNDAAMVGLLIAGLALVLTRQSAGVLVAAGVLFGLAAGIKITAIVVLPFAVLLAAPAGASWRALRRPAAALAGGAVLAVVGVSAGAGLGPGWVTNLSGSGVSVQWTSPPTAVGMTVDLVTHAFGVPGSAVPVTRVLGIAVLAVVLAVLWWRARTGDALLGAAFGLAATVLLAPVFHPWYATWPLALLAATLRRDTRWLVVPCAVAAALCLPDGYNLALAVKAQGAVAMTGFLVVLAILAVRRRRAAVPA
jgi:alpha-1,6-mannosyltransferase